MSTRLDTTATGARHTTLPIRVGHVGRLNFLGDWGISPNASDSGRQTNFLAERLSVSRATVSNWCVVSAGRIETPLPHNRTTHFAPPHCGVARRPCLAFGRQTSPEKEVVELALP
jgi:hypothetical protein